MDKTRLLVVLSLLSILATIAHAVADPLERYSRPETYPAFVTGPMQYVETPSGNSVAVRVTLPAGEDGAPVPGRFPTVLVQSGYNSGLIANLAIASGSFLGAPDPLLVKRGYALVAVDVIGTGAAEGGWELIGQEEQDGYGAVVDWIKLQGWYDGNLGVSGVSYMATTALLTAQERPDDIKAIFAGAALGDAMRGAAGTGGMANALLLSTWVSLTHFTATINGPLAAKTPELADRIEAATQRHIEQIDRFHLPMIDALVEGDPEVTFDGEFWRVRSPLERVDRIKAPTIVTGALHDVFQRDSPMLYEKLRDRVDARLIIYDGEHVQSYLPALLGTEETAPLSSLQLQWFDKYLKGIDSGTENIPAVTQYVKNYGMGWRGFASAPDWPHPEARAERWYLHGAGRLVSTTPPQRAHTHTMEAAAFADISYGKADDGRRLAIDVTLNDGSACSVSHAQWTLGFAAIFPPQVCYRNHRQVERGALNYQTAPMREDYYINGPIQADLWISSTTRDAVVSVRIDEVTPLGKVRPLTNGLLLASMRAVDVARSRHLDGEMIQPYHYLTQEAEQLLVPGEVVKLQVEVFPTSALIRRGSRLRISIAPSNQAQGVLNLIRRGNVAGGVTTLYSGPDHPSSVVVPVVPTSALN